MYACINLIYVCMYIHWNICIYICICKTMQTHTHTYIYTDKSDLYRCLLRHYTLLFLGFESYKKLVFQQRGCYVWSFQSGRGAGLKTFMCVLGCMGFSVNEGIEQSHRGNFCQEKTFILWGNLVEHYTYPLYLFEHLGSRVSWPVHGGWKIIKHVVVSQNRGYTFIT